MTARVVARSKPRRRAQATVEFMFVAPLFFLTLLGTVEGALWSVQTSAAVSAAEQGARVAASAALNPESLAPADTVLVERAVGGNLRNGLFGTRVVAWCNTAGCARYVGFPACPTTPDAVYTTFGANTVAVCAQVDPPLDPPSTQRPLLVTVRLVGYMAALVPGVFGFKGGQIPLNVGATTHTLTFAP